METVVVLTGAGISAESGCNTFRDNNGLWRKHRVEEVASPYAWQHTPQLVMDFYNERRKKLFTAQPNAGHKALVKLESKYHVIIITQNVDDLHERAGSSHVLHLHGELKKVRSTIDPTLVYELDKWELKLGDLCEKGSQLRPHIVWFGEAVPMIEQAIEMAKKADHFIIIGTSMAVYPAASLINYIKRSVPMYYVDPNATSISDSNLQIIKEKAGVGVPLLVELLLNG
ncbi:MAG: NAD-dependent deacylase [Bacteroidetes bacterium]|nr:MAG: NAD-dependent deacylase [Bacteroidota bacterium]